ncbi:MAG: cobalamin biosynthesis protein, partial [Niveispirillum sp.]|nr:cobalamin biosynthesis protein [Niveispirillum sp.]
MVLEALLGYPDAIFRVIRHPVVWIGTVIAALDRVLNRGPGWLRRLGGVATVIILVG